MKKIRVRGMCVGLVVALLAVTAASCGNGNGGDGGKTTIKAGYITDLTGVIASVMRPHYLAYHDVCSYLNENDPIPGGQLQLDTYDTQFDPGRWIPAYEWVRGKGAKLLFSPMPQASETYIPFLSKDKMPNFTPTCTGPMMESDWTYSVGMTVDGQWMGALKWVEDNWDQYPQKPKIATVGWNTQYEWDVVNAIEKYVLARPDKFDYVGAFLAPAGTVSWSMEIEKIKDCEWIGPCHGGGTGMATFVYEFRNKGYTDNRFFSGEAMPCWVSLMVDKAGWGAVNDTISHGAWPWWSDNYEIVKVCKELLTANHPDEAEDTMYAGVGYIAAFFQMYFVYQLVKATAEDVGVENVTGQAIQAHATNFTYDFGGIPPFDFGTDRTSVKYGAVYEWSAAEETLLRITDWLLAPTQ